MALFERSLLDCDPFGIIPIEPSSPAFYCALFGHDASPSDASSVDDAIASCCAPYYPAQQTSGNGCDIHYCGLPPYEAVDTETSTRTIIQAPYSTVVTETHTYDAIVGYPKVSSCLAGVAVGQYGIACRVAGSRRPVSMTGPEVISRTYAGYTAARTTASGSVGASGAVSNSAARLGGRWVCLLVVVGLILAT